LLEDRFRGGKGWLPDNQNFAHQVGKRYAFGSGLGEVRLFNIRWKIERDGHQTSYISRLPYAREHQ
jgi:hypothetical protein